MVNQLGKEVVILMEMITVSNEFLIKPKVIWLQMGSLRENE